jgi:hypothetical protein
VRWSPRADGGYDVLISSVDVGRAKVVTGIDGCGRIVGGSDQGAWVWDGTTLVILPTLTGTRGNRPSDGYQRRRHHNRCERFRELTREYCLSRDRLDWPRIVRTVS